MIYCIPQPRNDWAVIDHSSCACRTYAILGGTECSVRMLWTRVTALFTFVYFDTCSWLMSVYARDILSRLPQLLATCTAIFGSVLKIDSTKKVCKKLQGTTAGSASWCTNVGNERGEVLVSVLTESEGLEGLRPMATGIIGRFACKNVNC